MVMHVDMGPSLYLPSHRNVFTGRLIFTVNLILPSSSSVYRDEIFSLHVHSDKMSSKSSPAYAESGWVTVCFADLAG